MTESIILNSSHTDPILLKDAMDELSFIVVKPTPTTQPTKSVRLDTDNASIDSGISISSFEKTSRRIRIKPGRSSLDESILEEPERPCPDNVESVSRSSIETDENASIHTDPRWKKQAQNQNLKLMIPDDMILKADSLVNPFRRPPSGSFLVEDEENYFPLQSTNSFRNSPSGNDSPRWTPYRWHSRTSHSLNSRVSPGGMSSSLMSWSNRNRRTRYCCRCNSPWKKLSPRSRIIAILCAVIAMATIVGLVLAIHLTSKPTVADLSRGPRGAQPGPPPGPPLPVLGVLNVKSPSGAPSPVYLGASIDWQKDDPDNFNNDFGYPSAIHDGFFYMNETSLFTDRVVNSSGTLHPVSDIFAWTAALIRGTGAIMGISIIPVVPLSRISNDSFLQLAQKCSDINGLGIPVLLRFAPHMNGNWYPYGQDPLPFINAFRVLAQMVKTTANNTAMVWSPTSSLGYPFSRGLYEPVSGVNNPRLIALDTSGDGRLTIDDDPFTPYYPGDDVVDWVGLSSFYTAPFVNESYYPLPNNLVFPFPPGSNTAVNGTAPVTPDQPSPVNTTIPTGSVPAVPLFSYDNVVPGPVNLSRFSVSFEAQLTGTGTVFNFYRDFVQTKNKPLLISETGAGFFKGGTGYVSQTDEVVYKKAWYSQMLNETILKGYPLIRAIVLYNYQTPLNLTSVSPNFKNNSNTVPLTGLSRPVPDVADFSITSNSLMISEIRNMINPLIMKQQDGVNATVNQTQFLPNSTSTRNPAATENTTSISNGSVSATGFFIFANATARILDGILVNGTYVNGTWSLSSSTFYYRGRNNRTSFHANGSVVNFDPVFSNGTLAWNMTASPTVSVSSSRYSTTSVTPGSTPSTTTS